MSPMSRATSFPERGATLMPWRLASLMNLGLAKALRKPSCKTLNRSGGVPRWNRVQAEDTPTLNQEIGKLPLVGAEVQVLQRRHSRRRRRLRTIPDSQKRPDGTVLDEVAVTVLNEVEGQVHTLQLFPFQCRKDPGRALVPEHDLDRKPEGTLEFAHDGGRLAHTGCPNGEGLFPFLQVRECADRQVAPNPQHPWQGRKGGITQPHVFHGVEFDRSDLPSMPAKTIPVAKLTMVSPSPGCSA